MNRIVVVAVAALLAALSLAALPPAGAQASPEEPIHIIVPSTPGSATDVVAGGSGWWRLAPTLRLPRLRSSNGW